MGWQRDEFASALFGDFLNSAQSLCLNQKMRPSHPCLKTVLKIHLAEKESGVSLAPFELKESCCSVTGWFPRNWPSRRRLAARAGAHVV